MTGDSCLCSLVLPLATKVDFHRPLSMSDAGKYANEKELLYSLESCAKPVSETNCLWAVTGLTQELATSTVTSSAGSLANTWVYNELPLGSCTPNTPGHDALMFHVSILSDTNALTSRLKDMQPCMPLWGFNQSLQVVQ